MDRFAEWVGAEVDRDLPTGGYNVAPTDSIRIVLEREGHRRLIAAVWGFKPFWRDGAKQREPGWINARSETALESPAFGPALRGRRCIIPADAFYEWDRSHRPPQPYAIGPAAEGDLLALAGVWTDADHGAQTTAAILTTGPNPTMRPLHHRMPVILDRDHVDAWLAADATLDEIVPLLAPAPDDALRIWPVSTAVNKVGTNGAELLLPVEVVPTTLGLA